VIAGLICQYGNSIEPPIDATRLAELIAADVRLIPDSRRAKTWTQGRLSISSRGKWIITCGTRSEVFARATIAHEVGHAILYTKNGQVDRGLWESTAWSPFEESIAEYAGRALLIPASLQKVPHGENLAKLIATTIAPRWLVPFRLAAARLLDLPLSPEPSAVILWRQYHPFDREFIASMIRRVYRRAITKHEAGQANALKDKLPFPVARDLWLTVAASARVPLPLDAASLLPDAEGLIGPIANETKDLVADVAWSGWFRPEWLLWRGRPPGTYIPVKRGKMGESTSAQRLAAGQHELSRFREHFSIGDFSGSFLVDGFAHGDANQGVRYVVQVLTQPTDIATVERN
jgi:hypothetical protein